MQHIEILSYYVCTAYAVVLLVCVVGAFSSAYAANLAQRLALAMLAVWSVWRIELVMAHGWGYPHEPVVASALLLYALGSVHKTLKHKRASRKRNRRASDIL